MARADDTAMRVCQIRECFLVRRRRVQAARDGTTLGAAVLGSKVKPTLVLEPVECVAELLECVVALARRHASRHAESKVSPRSAGGGSGSGSGSGTGAGTDLQKELLQHCTWVVRTMEALDRQLADGDAVALMLGIHHSGYAERRCHVAPQVHRIPKVWATPSLFVAR